MPWLTLNDNKFKKFASCHSRNLSLYPSFKISWANRNNGKKNVCTKWGISKKNCGLNKTPCKRLLLLCVELLFSVNKQHVHLLAGKILEHLTVLVFLIKNDIFSEQKYRWKFRKLDFKGTTWKKSSISKNYPKLTIIPVYKTISSF